MEGIERLYDRGEISREEYNTIIQIRNLTDEEWEQIELKYNNGEISQEEYEVMEEIREMPEDWKSTENLFKGLGYAGLTGLWEGIQWEIGGKLTGWIPTNNTVLNSLFRIGIDTGFNAGDPVYRAGLEALLDGEDFGETFEKQGGLNAVLINSIIGLIGSAGGEAFDAHNSKKLMNRINNLDSIKGLDDSTIRRIKEILDQENRKKIIDFNKMTDVQLNQHVLELLNRDSQIDDIAKYLYGNQSGNISDQVKSKIANGLDAINRTGLLNNMDENKANMIRKQIVGDYFSNKIDLNDINKTYINNLSKAYENEAIRYIVFEKDYDKAAEYIFKNTDAAYNKVTFVKTEESIFENLRPFLGDEQAAVTTGRILENIIEKRGGYVEIANIDGIKINAIKDIDWGNTSIQLEDLRRMINNIPPELKGTIKEVNISDLYNPLDQYWKLQFKNKNHISGMTGGNGSINIFTMGDFSTIIHESGHCFDSVNQISSSKEWAASMQADSKINGNRMGVTYYADNAFNASGNRKEDFAESVKLYIINPDSFKKQYPNRWKILNKLFN